MNDSPVRTIIHGIKEHVQIHDPVRRGQLWLNRDGDESGVVDVEVCLGGSSKRRRSVFGHATHLNIRRRLQGTRRVVRDRCRHVRLQGGGDFIEHVRAVMRSGEHVPDTAE
jgi:hypothetical protein